MEQTCRLQYVTLGLLLCIAPICCIYKCQNGAIQCHMDPWTSWSDCSSTCTGGYSTRIRPMCCNKNYTSIEDCARDCNITKAQYYLYMSCGKPCAGNTGTTPPTNPTTKTKTVVGSSTVATSIIHTATPRYIAGPEKPCDPKCKYGSCRNGVCECETIFQGDSCDQPKTWFIVAACVVASVVLIGVIGLLSCFCSCCSRRCCCGKKNQTKPEEQEP